MNEVCDGAKPFMEENLLDQKHGREMIRANEAFREYSWLSRKLSEPFIKQLKQQAAEILKQLKAKNQLKKTLGILGSPDEKNDQIALASSKEFNLREMNEASGCVYPFMQRASNQPNDDTCLRGRRGFIHRF